MKTTKCLKAKTGKNHFIVAMRYILTAIFALVIVVAVTGCGAERDKSGNIPTQSDNTSHDNVEETAKNESFITSDTAAETDLAENIALAFYNEGDIFISYNDEEPLRLTYNKSHDVKFSQDGNRMFYIENWGLFYIDLNDKFSTPIAIDSSVTDYKICKNGTTVVYLKLTSELCKYSLDSKEIELIASDSSYDYGVSDDGSRIWYGLKSGYDNNIYLKINNDEAIVVNDGEIHPEIKKFTNSNCSLFYYVDSGTFYKKNVDNNKNQILATGIKSFKYAYTDIENFYYLKENHDTHKLSDALYFYDGEEEILLADNAIEILCSAKNVPVILYRAGNSNADSKYYIAIGGYKKELAATKIDIAYFSDDGNLLIYNEINTDKLSTIYKMNVSPDTDSLPLQIDSNVSSEYGISLLENEIVVYAKNTRKIESFGINSGISGDLYADGVLIDTNVFLNDVKYANSIFYYLTNAELAPYTYYQYLLRGTLKSKSSDNSVVINQNVFCFKTVPDGSIVYICDSDYNTISHILYRFKDDTNSKIADGATGIIR